ncbi:family 16 glycosylhydrolase [Lentisphaera profundi]|uniref:Family 16 glycosylhydrolase n=1 Tax=Lentisphaera profundi TaxID=1658616 RepID=A0ABY7VU26_9BACT|nr:family 16 glycosylhydrolase [Lentisphaera profundi]WDE97715.1 family 16 glycosylhydrolase [Lentisphaera profundi]
MIKQLSMFISLFMVSLTISCQKMNDVEETISPKIKSNNDWVFLEQVSDEFNEEHLDTEKWDFPQTWSTDWLWGDVSKGNVQLDKGLLKLKMEYLDTEEKKKHEMLGAYSWKTKFHSMPKMMFTTVSDEQYSGKKSLRISLQRQTQRALGELKQRIYLNPGVYNLSFRVKNPSKWISNKVILQGAGGGDKPHVLISEKIAHNPEWVEMSFSNLEVSADSNILELRFFGEGSGGDRIYLDDIKFNAVGSSENLIKNPGFEELGERQTHYRSGGIVSKHEYPGTTYVEARIKGASLHMGVCPAFWGSAGTLKEHREIDYVEMQQVPNVKENEYVFFMGWSETFYKEKPRYFPPALDRVSVDVGTDVRDGFHVYGSLITEKMAYFYFDGKLVGTSDVVDGKAYHSHNYHMFLSLGLRPPYRRTKNNKDPKITGEGFPTEMHVDYVRVWENKGMTHEGQEAPKLSPSNDALVKVRGH